MAEYGKLFARKPRPHRRKIAPAVRLAVARRDNWTCRHCGLKFDPAEGERWQGRYLPACGDIQLQIDHIEPYSLGGTNDPSNLQLLCHRCNIRKGAQRAVVQR